MRGALRAPYPVHCSAALRAHFRDHPRMMGAAARRVAFITSRFANYFVETKDGNRHSRTTRSRRGSPRSVPSRRYPATRRWPRLLLAIGEVRDLEGNGLWLLRDVHYNLIADEVQDLSIG